MKTRTVWRHAAALFGTLVLMLAIACPRIKQTPEEATDDDSTSGGGAGRGDAGADDELPINMLSSSELSNLCADLNERMRQLFSNRRLATFDCTRLYVNSGDPVSCAQAVAECVLETPDVANTAPRRPDFVIDGTECNAIRACPVTTTAFESCVEDRFAQSDRLISSMACSIAGDPEAIDEVEAELDRPRPTPASCSDVEARCAGLL
jgi:hypothetical protein